MVVGLQVWWCRVRSKAERACHGPNTNVVTPSETAVGISTWKYSAPILRPTKPRMSATAGRRYGRLATARAMSV